MPKRTTPPPADPLPLYRNCVQGDTVAFASLAFDWLRARLPFDAGMLVTSFVGQASFLDAHFDGFDDVPAMMGSWQSVAHLDLLAPRLVAEPGVARRHDKDDPLLAGPRFAPLHAHLAKFGIQHTLCIALAGEDPVLITVIILVRSQPGQRGTAEELALLETLGPVVAETFAACRRMALLRQSSQGMQQLCMARVDARGAYLQSSAAYCQRLWAGTAPQNVHLPAEALKAFSQGQPWPLPDRPYTLHAQRLQPEGTGWLLHLHPQRAADRLTPRQREVARRFADGESHTLVAQALGLSPATVRNQLSHVYAKLGVRHRAGLIAALATPPI